MDRSNIVHIYNKLNIMSGFADFITVCHITKSITPNKILEIGTGNADWCIGINTILDNTPDITAVENFQFIEHDYYGTEWPKSKELLEQKIEQTCKELNCKHNIKVLDIDARLLPNKFKHEKFDLIRLDCLNDAEEIESILRWVHTSLTKNGLLFIDDIKPAILINRLLVAMDLVKEKKLKIIWIGDKEALFSQWNSNRNFITNDMKKNIEYMIRTYYGRRFKSFELIKWNWQIKHIDGYGHNEYWSGRPAI